MTKKVEKTRAQLVEENNQLQGILREKNDREELRNKNLSDALGMTTTITDLNQLYSRTSQRETIYATWESILVRIGQFKESYDRDQKFIDIVEREKQLDRRERDFAEKNSIHK